MEYEIESMVGDDYCSITAQGDYFVQFCNPPLPTLVADNATLGEYNYDVILMLDTSGSMFGEKISHAVDAMKNIINQLPEGDKFNIIRYGNKVRSWRQGMSAVDQKTQEKASEFLDNITVGGSTDIEGALLEAINIAEQSETGRIPIILFLTDGGPNVGGNDVQTIVSSVSNRAGYQISINGISLGTNDLNGWQLVQRLTQKNRGLSAKLFDIASFPVEIPRKFAEMKEHARSLRGLSDIKFKMNGDYVYDLTNTHFADYAEGSDLVVLGKLKDHQIQTVPFVLEYTDVEGTVWTENKLVRVRTVNASDDSEDRFTAGQAEYNPIQQQWAVTAVHQILESRAQAQSEEEYNLLTQEAKKLSYAHQIVSPVVSFLVRKPKSSLNLINSRLGEGSEERERRSSTQQQETHEIRYQYRKLMWRPNQQDGLEQAENQMEKLLASSNQDEQTDENNLWMALGSSPLMAFYKLNDYMNSKACLALPSLSGSFKLISLSDSVIEASINHEQIQRITITSADGQITIDGEITLTRGEISIDLDLDQDFHFGPWVARRTGKSLHLMKDQTLSLIITPIDDRIDIEVSGTLEHTDGMLEEFTGLNIELIEKHRSNKQMERTTLLINDNFVPAESVVVDSYDENQLTQRCWRVDNVLLN